jgi:hypothetical protein
MPPLEPDCLTGTQMPAMADPTPDSMTLQTAMTQDDYARYSVAMRRATGWMPTLIYVGAFFAAIPVALVFRLLGQHLALVPQDVDLIGKFSLFAFMLGAMAIILAGAIAGRLAFRRQVQGTLNAFEPKTVVLDLEGVTVTGQLSHTHWRWPAISKLALESGFILMWVGGSTPFVVPDRSFAGPAERDAAIAFIRARLSETSYGSSAPPA